MLYNNEAGNRFMRNVRSAKDVRHVVSGKDGMLYSLSGTAMLASVETFQTKLTVNNQDYMPLGDHFIHKVPVSVAVSLVFTEVLITDELFIEQIFQGLKSGEMPFFDFQGSIRGRDGTWQRVNYRKCVPDGDIDIQNFGVGDIIKRQWNWAVNEPPELQEMFNRGFGFSEA